MRNVILWSAIVLLAVVDLIWAATDGLRLVWFALAFILVICAIGLLYSRIRSRARVGAFFLSAGTIYSALSVVGVLAYLSFIRNPPPRDAMLAAIDSAMGFNWPAAMRWLDLHPMIEHWLSFCYWSMSSQMLAALVILSALDRLDRLGEMTWLLAISVMICGALSVVVPADCAWSFYHIEPHSDACRVPLIKALRAGEVKEIVVGGTAGIVTFPSFHAASGVILIWAARGIRYLFPLSLMINASMIVATPNFGGHYLIDVITGLTIAAALMAVEQSFARGAPTRARAEADKAANAEALRGAGLPACQNAGNLEKAAP